MVDEDFVMGYAVGYNDGKGSGGGSNEPFSEIVIEQNYLFDNSEYGVATLDFKKSHCWRQGGLASRVVKNPGGITPYRTIWGPVNNRQYKWGYAMTKNGKVIGVVLSDLTIASDDESWSYETGEWVKTGETTHVFGKCSIVKSDKSTDTEQIFNMVMDVDGTQKTQLLARRYMTNSGWGVTHWYGHGPHLMDDAEFANWLTAFNENGITLEEV